MAYPGSRLYDLAIEQGWRLPETWDGFSQLSVDTLPLPTRHVSASEVLRFRDQAFHDYFSNPRYLEMLERTFDAQTREHVQQMTGKKLDRKHV
jgi:hypothetical protein